MENRVSPAIPCVHHEHVHTHPRRWRDAIRARGFGGASPAENISVHSVSAFSPLSLLRVIYLLNKRSERQENLN